MDTENNTTKRGFRKAYDLLPLGVATEVKCQISDACEWQSNSTFHNKLKGATPLKTLEVKAITQILAKHNISFLGNYIKINA